jgi:SpoVK/Ycf46/Vps4 family AAA+-type ATPase
LEDEFNFEELATLTQNWSGSDLKELCRRVVLENYLEDKVKKTED